jgi:hypothetical protein
MNDRHKEKQIAKLKARMDELDNQTSLIVDDLRKLIGEEELLKWLKWTTRERLAPNAGSSQRSRPVE